MIINSTIVPLYPQSFAARVIHFANGLARRSATVGIVLLKEKLSPYTHWGDATFLVHPLIFAILFASSFVFVLSPYPPIAHCEGSLGVLPSRLTRGIPYTSL